MWIRRRSGRVRDAARTGMGNRIYVGNLSYGTAEDGLRAVFEESGYKVSDVHIVTDRETGRSRGFAFVEVEDNDALNSAISALDGREVDGRRLALSEARPRRPRDGGGGGGGGGRYNNDRRPPVQERRVVVVVVVVVVATTTTDAHPSKNDVARTVAAVAAVAVVVTAAVAADAVTAVAAAAVAVVAASTTCHLVRPRTPWSNPLAARASVARSGRTTRIATVVAMAAAVAATTIAAPATASDAVGTTKATGRLVVA
jgi:hypothetical protein